MDETGKRERDFPNCLFFICAGIGNIGEVGRWVARSKARDKTARQTECGKTLRVRACVRVCAIRNILEGEKLTKVDKHRGMYPSVKGKRRRLAEAIVDPDNEKTITALCKEIGISRTTFYNWQSDPEFMGYIEYLVESYTTSAIPEAWKQIIKKVEKGNMDAIRLLLEVKGKLKPMGSNSANVVIFAGENDIKE